MSAGNNIWPMKICMGTYERLGPKSMKRECVFDVIAREVNKMLYISLWDGIQIMGKNPVDKQESFPIVDSLNR